MVPIGSLEQHGPHLPLSTDSVIATKVAEELARELGAFLLPCLPYSCSIEHSAFPGTVWLSPETLASVVRDVVSSLLRQGFDVVVLVNGHGGNMVLRPVVRSLNLLSGAVRVILVDVASIMCELAAGDLHAGEVETSIMMHLRPELVRRVPEGLDEVPEAPREYLDYLGFRGLCSRGVWGRPSRASSERGEKYLLAIIDRALAHVRRVLELAGPSSQ